MNERRYDIDWIRVIVFDILIFWHVGLFFVSWILYEYMIRRVALLRPLFGIKTIFTFSIIPFCFLYPRFANNPDDIAGKWITPEGKSIILIEYKEGKYTGKILRIHPKEYINNAPPKDLLNINPDLRSRSLEGLVIFSGFKYDKSKERWNIELVYDPERGKYFEGHISLEGRNQLIVRGFVPGKRWLGNTEIWKRVEGSSPI